MKKAVIACFIFLGSNLSVANSTEQWQCALDLQQGDKGSMTLEKSNASVTGSISINRNGSDFSQEVEGRWNQQEVELKRFVNNSSNQTMHGIAIRVGSKQVKMGGRFAEGLNGVWSADCDLVSAVASKDAASSDKTASQAEPSISVRTIPPQPSQRDKIEFSARAFHADGIESIAFYVNDKEIHRCESEQCSVKYGPLKAGKSQWHVIAKSKSGVENTQRDIDLLIATNANSGKCHISGIATGPAVAQSQSVGIRLTRRGKDQSTRFDAGIYSFENLTAGNYVMSVDAADNLGVIVSPASVQIKCGAGGSIQQNFEFR